MPTCIGKVCKICFDICYVKSLTIVLLVHFDSGLFHATSEHCWDSITWSMLGVPFISALLNSAFLLYILLLCNLSELNLKCYDEISFPVRTLKILIPFVIKTIFLAVLMSVTIATYFMCFYFILFYFLFSYLSFSSDYEFIL